MSETKRFAGVVVGVVTAVLSLIPLHPIRSITSAEAQNKLCRIMPLGDSITYDYTGDGTGYRQPLWLSLVTAGYKVDFVGSEKAGEGKMPLFDPDNAGFPGITPSCINVAGQYWGCSNRTGILELLQNGTRKFVDSNGAVQMRIVTNGPYLQGNTVDPNQKFDTKPPDIILLHIGSNGIDSQALVQKWAADVGLILKEIDDFAKEQNKELTVILARIINVNCSKGTFPWCTPSFPISVPNIIDFNNKVADIAANRPSDEKIKIVLVDMEKEARLNYGEPANSAVYAANGLAIPTGDDFYDTIHPNQSGYDKMALVWKNALVQNQLPSNCNLSTDSIPPSPPTNLKLN